MCGVNCASQLLPLVPTVFQIFVSNLGPLFRHADDAIHLIDLLTMLGIGCTRMYVVVCEVNIKEAYFLVLYM